MLWGKLLLLWLAGNGFRSGGVDNKPSPLREEFAFFEPCWDDVSLCRVLPAGGKVDVTETGVPNLLKNVVKINEPFNFHGLFLFDNTASIRNDVRRKGVIPGRELAYLVVGVRLRLCSSDWLKSWKRTPRYFCCDLGPW